jgi:fumarylacetoacetase
MPDSGGFGIENLPYGVVQPAGGDARPAVRLGDDAIDLRAIAGLLDVPDGTFDAPTLNRFLMLGRATWSATRARLIELIDAGRELPLIALDGADLLLPVDVGDYVDFYSSIEHATNLGRLFRPDAEPLLPNWRHLPVGYHGRAGTVVVSGTPIRRPIGQLPGDPPTFGPEPRLDIELELGFITGPGPALGTPISAADAADHIFGFVLVNDWSARAIQRWEYQPLGPFLGKSFATSISPWIVPLEALESRRVPGPAQDPLPFDYLRVREPWALDIDLEVELNGTIISRTNARGLYWNPAQQLAHATINGATIRAGDLFASGTISGAEPGSYGSLIELTRGGAEPLDLPSGPRTFLEDGDSVILRGAAGAISLGEVRGTVEKPHGDD